jgi:hypothetical protein
VYTTHLKPSVERQQGLTEYINVRQLDIICCRVPIDPKVRLAGGPYPHEGRVEGRMADGTWGSVCDTSYGLPYWPSVLCREYGYLR